MTAHFRWACLGVTARSLGGIRAPPSEQDARCRHMKVSFLRLAAAGLFATGSAQAADLPTRKSAPVEYLRICAVLRSRLLLHPRHRHLHQDRRPRPSSNMRPATSSTGAPMCRASMRPAVSASTRARRPIGACCAPSSAWTSAATAATPRWAPSARAAARAAATKIVLRPGPGPFPNFCGRRYGGNRLQTGVVIGAPSCNGAG